MTLIEHLAHQKEVHMQRVDATEAEIARAVADGEGSRELRRLTGDLLAAEGVARFYHHAHAVANHVDGDTVTVLSWLVEQAVAGADDRWSGRGNDDRRLVHDAVLRAIEDVHRVATR